MLLIAKSNMEQPKVVNSISPFCISMVANLPPYSADLLLYKGYPSSPVAVLHTMLEDIAYAIFRLSCMVNLDSVYRKVHASYFSSQLLTNPYRRRHRVFQHIKSSISFEVILS